MSNSNSLVCVWSQLAQSSGRSQAAVVVSPPLKGARWVVAGGCCTPYTYHRGATLPINGTIHVAERYAIDFVQLNDKNMIYSGFFRCGPKGWWLLMTHCGLAARKDDAAQQWK